MFTAKEALHRVGKKYGKTRLARDIGVAKNKIQAFINQISIGQPDAHLNIEKFIDVVNKTGDMLPLQAVAYRCGAVVAPMPRVEYPADTDLVEAIADLQEDFAETMQEVSSAMKAGEINTKHAKEVMREGLEDLQKLSLIVGHIYMMAEDREEHPEIAQAWEHLAVESVSS